MCERLSRSVGRRNDKALEDLGSYPLLGRVVGAFRDQHPVEIRTGKHTFVVVITSINPAAKEFGCQVLTGSAELDPVDVALNRELLVRFFELTAIESLPDQAE